MWTEEFYGRQKGRERDGIQFNEHDKRNLKSDGGDNKDKGFTKCFKTMKGIRQGCVMSPALFNLYIADIDKVLEKHGIEGELGGVRVWSLACG